VSQGRQPYSPRTGPAPTGQHTLGSGQHTLGSFNNNRGPGPGSPIRMTNNLQSSGPRIPSRSPPPH
jgi:hypothetical protein